MSVGELCNRDVVIVDRDDAVLQAAKLMRESHVGDVIVVDVRNARRMPVGILTDRDIVIELVAEEVDLGSISVGDAMSTHLLTLCESDELADSIARMRSAGVRRAPVVDNEGGLIGILTLDDALEVLAEELTNLAHLLERERHRERETRSQP